MTPHKILKLFAVTGALLGLSTKASEPTPPTPGMTILASSEQDGLKKNCAELTLKPDIICQHGEYKVGYYGSFYRSKETTGAEIEWLTLVSKIRAENEEWGLEIGRSSTREYPGYLYTPTTISFDNQGMIKGSSRTFTGTTLTHKSTGFTLGQVANDTRMTPTHWDSTLLGWAKELDEEWALHLQASGGHRPLSTVAATIKWQPTATATLVVEAFHWNRETTGILTAGYQLTDDLLLFTGTQMTAPHHGKPNGLATTGASYRLGKGFTILTAFQQKFGTEKTTSLLLGIKYACDFRQR